MVIFLAVMLAIVVTSIFWFMVFADSARNWNCGDLIVDLSDPEKDIFRLEIKPDFEEKITTYTIAAFNIRRIGNSNEKQSL